ncbi:hypothetical protein P170DRAFT_416548 [Aspergillus steynii IBT 23096]|uniref:Zn(2)-C6 fungal-type domain-containing protein n=1 Tax=Aspergillus steynii IBT 23096 TaxID=1392250 RepID=A0A2I2FU11_9EURO|nr:uncharacterized protein P170DRAFT_416548 [Aspergillus steynii IBT 23096]PLB44130.1 hypothetical protein P170DRAFT_416548 [Aspergillus steynii IBT 23096]
MDRPPAAKRPRLSMACNMCRQRKVKCDAEYPKCRNCRQRNQTCVTTDPQRPGVTGVREWLELPEKVSGFVARDDDREIPREEELSPQDQEQQQSPSNDVIETEKNDGVSPVHHPFITSLNVEHETNRMKIMGGSSSQCLAKSLDVFFKAARLKPVSSSFRHGMRHAEELELSLKLSLPTLPSQETRDRYLSMYESRIHPLYPIFDPKALRAAVEQLATLSDYAELSRDNVPVLASAYLLMSFGADEATQCITEKGDMYCHAATGLLSHIIVTPYFPAVQTLLLFTIVYRGRNQEGLAWQTLGIATRIAYTLGIYRLTSSQTSNLQPVDQCLYKQVWAVCCCLDKMMQIESGRPAVINPEHIPPVGSLSSESSFLLWHLGLADYQSNISQHVYNYRPGSRSVRQILRDTARLDHSLLTWASKFPPELRPGNDLFCADSDFHIVAFLSIQYQETLIALHRAALIAPSASFNSEVARHCADEPSQFRLRNGESICISSARAIAKLSIELLERDSDSRLIPAGPSLLACIVLAIYLMKHPGSKLQAMDLQLLKACLEYSSTRLASCNANVHFLEGLAAIYDQTAAHLKAHAQSEQRPPMISPGRNARAQISTQPHQRCQLPAISTNDNPHSQNALLTPSTYEDNPPATWRRELENLPDLSNPSLDSSIGARQHQSSHPSHIPLADGEVGRQYHGVTREQGSVHENGSSMDQFAALGDCPNPVDGAVFPFEGYNVEDLWNWMLYFDSPAGLDGVS